MGIYKDGSFSDPLALTTLKSNATGTPTVFQDGSGTEIIQGCTAWVNFNGTGTVAIRDSFNVSSITDNGVGDYTVNFASAMANTNYCAVAQSLYNGVAYTVMSGPTPYSVNSATYYSLRISDGVLIDSDFVQIAIFGGK